MSEEQPESSQETKMDPRLLSRGVGIEVNLQEMVEQAQENRTQMSSGSLAGAGQQKGSKIHIPEVSEELITKVDNVLSIVRNLETDQREIYHYVRAMAPKRQAQEIRTQMSSGSLAGAGQQKGSKIHIPEVSEELITKVDNVLSIVRNLKTDQREIYHYVRAMAPKHRIIQTAGPCVHLETSNQINSDNAYFQKLRNSMKK